jgi:tRNA (guanine37-N1)-methyltransferase
MMQLKAGVITLFPEMFAALNYGVIGRAQKRRLFDLSLYPLRTFSTHKHGKVDDISYGGGAGMVMACEPLVAALDQAKQKLGENSRVVYLSPQGKCFNAMMALELLKQVNNHPTPFIFIAGRYEGIDQRFIDHYVNESWSIGDYVISGGELAIMVVLDTLVRLIPGVLGHADSSQQDSYFFMQGLFDYPHYTRPPSFQGWAVPDILLSGHHQAIARWRLKQALGQTFLKRPDLLKIRGLSDEEQALLDSFLHEQHIKESTNG